MTDSENAKDFSNKVVNFLKTNGKFDEFRKKCASEIENHTSFVNARREVEELVRLRVVNNRKSDFPLTKNQLRQEIRAMLSKRKDLLAAADSSIQFSLHKNKILFSEEINEVSTKFEEEEKLKKEEADKLAMAEQLSKEAEAVQEPEEEVEDIPPPPPPPRPVVKPVSSNDTALLMQESIFDTNGNNMFSTPHNMNINDLLANVQSSDFTGQSCDLPSAPTEPCEPEPENYSYNYDDSLPQDDFNKVLDTANSLTEPPKDKVDDKSYKFDKEEYSHYIESKSERSRYDEIRDYKHEFSRYSYDSDYKRSSEKSRKYVDDYRERSYSKHRNSLSPKQIAAEYEKYKEYSRSREYSLERLFKPPDYYVSSSRSGRRERRKREEEWYAKHHYSIKYGHALNSSHKYPEHSRRDEKYLEMLRRDDKYPDTSRRDDKYLELPRRDDNYSGISHRDGRYPDMPIRDTILSEYSRYDKKKHTDPYYKTEHINVKENMNDPRSHHTATDMMIKDIRNSVEMSSSHDTIAFDNEFEPPNAASPLVSPSPKPTFQTDENKSTKEDATSIKLPIQVKNALPKPQVIENLTPSPDNLDRLVEKAIANIPKTPEDTLPVFAEKEQNEPPLSKDIIKTKSPIKSQVLINDTNISDPLIISNKQSFLETKRSMIDSILPKPKYCSMLKDGFSSSEDLQNVHASPKDHVHEPKPVIISKAQPHTPPEPHTPPKSSPPHKPCTPPEPQVIPPALHNELKESQDILQSFGLKFNPISLKVACNITPDSQTTSICKSPEPIIKKPCSPPEPPLFTNQYLALSNKIQEAAIMSMTSPPPQFDNQVLSRPLPPSVAIERIAALEKAEPLVPANKKTLAEILGGMRKPTPASPVILTTKRMKRNPNGSTRLPDSSDTEEGEILSDQDDDITAIANSKLEDNDDKSCGIVLEQTSHGDLTSVTESSNGQAIDKKSDDNVFSNIQTIKPVNESIVIKSKRDFFKARFFQPDAKIDFSVPEVFSENSNQNTDAYVMKDNKLEPEKPECSSEKKEDKPESNTDIEVGSKYSRKMRFMKVLKEHMNVQESESTNKTDPDKTKASVTEENTSTLPVTQVTSVSTTSTTQSAPPTESETAALSLLGKRKRFLNDYIASLESNPHPKSPQKPTIKEDTVLSLPEQLPKLRIKPTSSGSYASETLSGNSPVPPPLRKANSTSILEASVKEAGVPKCIIKLGRNSWNAADNASAAPSLKGRSKRSKVQPRRSLRTREDSTDSNKSGDIQESVTEKSRNSRSRKLSIKSVSASKSYDTVPDDEEKSDNSFDIEDNDRSRKSGRTRKTIKRLNL